MKLPELSIRQAGDMIFMTGGVVGAAALYEQYLGHHPVTISGIIGVFTILLAINAVFYLHFEKTPLDSVMELL